ncbi:MAG TPA: hypothetical protein VJ377_11110, partial [Dehalococcoidales bacterium]|nr:hypothetical protein [Dehalococcoidales bacterium]
MVDTEFKCPVCSTKQNVQRNPFPSYRAVALHIAGKIKGGYDFDAHKIWAYENCGQNEIDRALADARAKNDINIIGKLLLLPVKQWHEEREKGSIG